MNDRRLIWIVCAVAISVIAGCAPKSPRPVAALRGTVDLDRLTPLHPGWSHIGQFDEAMAEVRRGSAQQKSVLGDITLETLPAMTIAAPSRPDIGLGAERSRLEALGKKQLSMLRNRSAVERDLELRRERRLWTVEAEQKYQLRLKDIESRYAADYDQVIAEQTQEKLNLMLQIRALRDTIDHWKLSVPPAPELLRAKQELTDKQARYDAADTHLVATVAAAARRRSDEIAAANADRLGYVDQKHTALEALLKADDARQLEREALRLQAEREGLLAEIGSVETTSAPLVGSLALMTVHEAQIAGASNARDLRDGERRIAAQRDRWRSFLRDDARIAALDVATTNNWSITFGKPRLGARDLTAEVADALKAGAWKSGFASRKSEAPSHASEILSRPRYSSMTVKHDGRA